MSAKDTPQECNKSKTNDLPTGGVTLESSQTKLATYFLKLQMPQALFVPGTYNAGTHGKNDYLNMATNQWVRVNLSYQHPNIQVVGGFVVKQFDENGCEVMVYSNTEGRVYVCRLEFKPLYFFSYAPSPFV